MERTAFNNSNQPLVTKKPVQMNIPIKLSVALFILLSAACTDNYTSMVTRINPDGSCYREFTEMADSAFMVGNTKDSNPFPVLLDSTWKVSWTYSPESGKEKYSNQWPLKQWKDDPDTSKHLLLRVRITKVYPTVSEMSKTFRFNNSRWDSIAPKSSLEKRFRWFFTFYDFTETYAAYNPLKLEPIDKYLSKEEIAMYLGNNPKFPPELNGREIRDLLNGLDSKQETWFNKNMFEEYYRIVKHNVGKLTPQLIDTAKLTEAKDSVYATMKDSIIHGDPGYMMRKLCDRFKIEFPQQIYDSTEVEFKSLKENIERTFKMELNYQLIMPGKLIETNSKQIHGDTLAWKTDRYRFFFNDFEIHAKSRVANVWAFVVSGLFIAGVALSFLVKRR